jgi:cytochrome c oxidase subunit 2
MTPPVRSKPINGAVALLVLALALAIVPAAVAGNGGFAPPSPASPNAEGISTTYWFVAIFTGVIFLLVEGALILFIVRYRRRRRPRTEDGPDVHGHTRLEIAWTVIPVLIVAVIASLVFYELPGIADVPSATAAGGREDVSVTGARYYWQFEYPNGAIAIDRLRVPAGKNVKLEVTAPDWDVIHSWWIPRLGGKIDAIPGRVNTTWFNADQPGIYTGQCAELCGIYHAKMTADVQAMTQAEFDEWVDARAQGEGLGEELFDGVCAKCHGLNGEGGYGPPLEGNPTVADPAAVENVVRNGQGNMPPVGKDWSDEQMKALTDYLGQEIAGGSQG